MGNKRKRCDAIGVLPAGTGWLEPKDLAFGRPWDRAAVPACPPHLHPMSTAQWPIAWWSAGAGEKEACPLPNASTPARGPKMSPWDIRQWPSACRLNARLDIDSDRPLLHSQCASSHDNIASAPSVRCQTLPKQRHAAHVSNGHASGERPQHYELAPLAKGRSRPKNGPKWPKMAQKCPFPAAEPTVK